MRQGANRSRLGARRRPTRAEIEPAALALLQRHGATIMATARRFAATPEDAEDAYQRGVEILLTKAPTTAEEELVPWLRTVVKHEAWALRRQRQRAAPVADDGHVPEPPSEAALTHDQARADRPAAARRRGVEAAEAAGDPRAAAEGRGLQLQADTGGHGLDLHEGQPLLDRGTQGVLRARCRHRGRRRVRAAGAAPVEARGRRGDRGGPGGAAAAHPHVPVLPRARCASTAARRPRPRRSCRPPSSRFPAGPPSWICPRGYWRGSPGGRRRRTPPSRWRARRRSRRWPPRRRCSAAGRRSPCSRSSGAPGPAKRIERAERDQARTTPVRAREPRAGRGRAHPGLAGPAGPHARGAPSARSQTQARHPPSRSSSPPGRPASRSRTPRP